MRKVLVVVDRSEPNLDEVCGELAAAAFGLGETHVVAVLLGNDLAEPAALLGDRFHAVHVFDDSSLDSPDADLYAQMLAPLIEREKPLATLILHTNNGMELAPVLAVKVGTPLLSDCLELVANTEGLQATRFLYGGKIQARVSAAPSANGIMATVRPGAFDSSLAPRGVGGAIIEEPIPKSTSRRRLVDTLRAEPGAVDISQAEVLVGVGRGIEEQENLEIIESLADAFGAELACTRPIVDKKWLDKNRQVGTSGVTVKPKIYLALGISGSFQHMGGIKGRPFIVAVNKDPAAPIFGVADVGIVGDLLDLAPLLEEKIREQKG